MKQNHYIHLLRTMRQYAPDKQLFFWMIFFSVISKLIRLVEPYLFGQIINTLQIGAPTMRNDLLWLLIAFPVLTLSTRIFHGISRLREEKIRFQVNEAHITDLFTRASRLPLSWHTEHHSGTTIDKITKATNALKEFSGNNFMYLNTIVLSLGAFFSISIIRWPAGIILLGIVVITGYVVNRFDIKLADLITKKNTKEHHVMSGLFDFLSNIKTIITLRCEDRARQSIHERVSAIYPVFKKYTILNERKWFSMDMLMSITIFIICGLYLFQVIQANELIMIGTFTMLRQYTEKMRVAFENFTRQYGTIMTLSTDLKSVDTIIEEEQKIPHLPTLPTFDSQHPIHLSGLFFSYNKHDHAKVLSDIALDLIPGQRIALIGSSGSGKSTLMMLLRGLYPVDQVTMRIGNDSFDQLTALSQYASLIPQDPEIFEQTIRYNITMGLAIDDAVIKTYTDIACFSDVIETLPRGLETDIKEKGVNLSGGQKQRLALARGLLLSEQSRVMLLDESTSSVDIHNEQRIYTNIMTHFGDTCIVASLHKLHLLPMFDKIYLLDQGYIIESGSFQELIKKRSGKVAQMRESHIHST